MRGLYRPSGEYNDYKAASITGAMTLQNIFKNLAEQLQPMLGPGDLVMNMFSRGALQLARCSRRVSGERLTADADVCLPGLILQTSCF